MAITWTGISGTQHDGRDHSGAVVSAGAAMKPASPTGFNQTAYSTTLTVVPAAVDVGTLTLLSEVVTAIGTLQSAINDNRKLINALIDILQDRELAS